MGTKLLFEIGTLCGFQLRKFSHQSVSGDRVLCLSSVVSDRSASSRWLCFPVESKTNPFRVNVCSREPSFHHRVRLAAEVQGMGKS